MSFGVHQFTNPMKTQILQPRLHWTKLSRLLARVTKPFTAFLLIILTIISVGIIRPALSQPAGNNNQESGSQGSLMFPLTIYRERLKMVGGSEQISFQPVGIGESFAVPSGSPIIVGNPPFPYQFTKAYFYVKSNDKREFKEIIRKDSELSSIILESNPNSSTGKLVVEASPPTIAPEITSSSNAAEKQVLNASNAIHFEIKNAPEYVANANNSANQNQLFIWKPSSDIFEITTSGNLNQYGTLSLKQPVVPNNAKEIHLTVLLGNQIISRIELKQTANANEWIVNKTENMLKIKSYHRDELSISNHFGSIAFALLTALCSYALIAWAVFWYRTRNSTSESSRNQNPSLNDLNPLFIASGINGKVSLSRLQLLWFTILVMSVLVFVFIQTGSLSDLPESVLALLGVSASGTILSGLTTVNKDRLSFENWQWLKDQGWLAGNRTPTRWTDLLLDEDGSLNIYKFQLLFSSILVGIALVLFGGNNLLGFKIPANFAQLLGLSNIAYVLGKVVTPTGMPELDKKIADLVTMEKGLKASTIAGSLPKNEELANYLVQARNVAGMTKVAFADMGGTKFDEIKNVSDNDLMPPWVPANWLIPSHSASPSDPTLQGLLQDRTDGSRAQPDGFALR